MTLIELLVVLTIMAAVATIALTGATEMMNQSKTDETVRRGNLFMETINGNGFTASRFIADMGRMPRVISTGNGKILCELWNSGQIDADVRWSNETFDFTSHPWPEPWSSLPDEIEVPCGWRGPYLNIAKEQLYDGYGNEWLVNTGSWSSETWETNAAASLDDKILGIKSYGRDNVENGTEWYNKEREFKFSEGSCTCDLYVTLKYIDIDPDPDVARNLNNTYMDKVRVALFIPYVRRTDKGVKRILAERNGASGATATYDIKPDAIDNYSHQESAAWEDYHQVKFTNLAPGPRKLYAYGFLNPDSNKLASGIIHLDLKPGSNSVTVYLTKGL